MRIIPSIVINGESAVNTVSYSSPIYLGDPSHIAHLYTAMGAPELCLIRRTQTELTNRDFLTIEGVASNAFIPLCYGGGIRTYEHCLTILSLGVEKIIFNTLPREKGFDIITRVSSLYGSQAIALMIDIDEATSHRTPYSESLKKYIFSAVDSGVGEVILSVKTKNGTFSGISKKSAAFSSRLNLPVPVLLAGGFNTIDQVTELSSQYDFSGVLVGSSFSFATYSRESRLVNTRDMHQNNVFDND